MKLSLRSVLFIASALLMMFGAIAYSFILLPDLHGDLVEIGVRPTVLGSTVLHLYFAAFAMFGFALMVTAVSDPDGTRYPTVAPSSGGHREVQRCPCSSSGVRNR